MNSIIFLGDSLHAAENAFSAAKVGIDCWCKPNPKYGIILSKWEGSRYNGEYKVIKVKRPLQDLKEAPSKDGFYH